MNLRDLKYFVTVAELGHFGRAAEACNVSQPTLSMQLKKLEETLGAPLFERSRRQLLLTPMGEQALAKARIILGASDELIKIGRHSADPLAGEITLGAFPTLAPYLLPLIMPPLRKNFPKLSIRLLEEKTHDLLEKLEQGQIDCALIALPVAHHGLHAEPLFEEPFTLAVHAQHALAKRKTITLGELGHHTLLLLDEGHCLREQALAVCRRIGIRESQNFRATSLETLRQMVASGNAATLMPKLAIRSDDKNIRYIPFEEPPPSRTIALVWRKATARAPLMNALAEVMRERFG